MPAPSPITRSQRSPTLLDRLASIGVLTRPAPPSERPGPGDTRIRWVAGYFRLLTVGCGFLSIMMTVALTTASGRASITPKGHPFLATGMAILFTIGFAHTARLISAGSRRGGFLAIGLFATDLIWTVANGPFRPFSLAISVVGLAVLGSVWKYLDDYEP
jgi:hypothetical protein